MKQVMTVPLRDVVVFPHMVIPLFVGRDKSVRALELAMAGSKQVLLVAQKSPDNNDPSLTELYRVGTLATILQLLRLPDGTIKVLVEGISRVAIDAMVEEDGHLLADVETLTAQALDEETHNAQVKSLLLEFSNYCRGTEKISNDAITLIKSIDELGRLTDTIASHLQLKLAAKQAILEMAEVTARTEHLMSILIAERDIMQLEKRIRSRVKKQMEKSQREYYLNEQIKAIQKELGNLDEKGMDEATAIKQKITKSGMPAAAKEKANTELRKLKQMSPMSAEAAVVRSYLDWLTSLPWKKHSRISKDLSKASDILNADHYGLEDVKERILEFLAVQSRIGRVRGPILCLVGPPGVGKTSLGESIARATNRKFVRMALGGLRDEAEIRGHRRTYIGSMPGRIIQKITKAKVRNPLFLLDEIDKMAMDLRGDPASALLEVLDPEQNANFNDHYLEVDYSLSDVMFICTSNSMNIPPALMDRMEIIRIPGYTEDEKLNIGRKYLLPKQLENNGMKPKELSLSDDGLSRIIRLYTREAGVRGFERQLSKIVRKVIKEQVLSGKRKSIKLSAADIEHYLGVAKYDYGRAKEHNQIGQVTGLAWTSVGGELLTIESAIVPGKGKVISTGSLGNVMQESISAAITVVKSRAASLGINRMVVDAHDFHIHVPEGATPKDGPSAGIAMCTALVSALADIKIRSDVAMTGEITLSGQVLPIGGLKEKLLAAHRGGIERVIIPAGNEKDLKDIPDNIKADLEIRPVKWIEEVLELVLEHSPLPLTDAQLEEEKLWIERQTPGIGGDVVSTH